MIVPQVKKENPPHGIAEECAIYFNLDGRKPIFTFGDTIYNPHNGLIDQALYAHETVHTNQQGNEPLAWWKRYFVDKRFRFEQELQAYRVQYRWIKRTVKDKNTQTKILLQLADDLSSPMYGKLCTKSQALTLIKQNIK